VESAAEVLRPASVVEICELRAALVTEPVSEPEEAAPDPMIAAVDEEFALPLAASGPKS
jgi:hypothetical protein